MNSKNELLHGWGHAPVLRCRSWRPEKGRELAQLVRHADAPLVARGLGRSYGDAALQPTGVVRTERLDHFLAFDEQEGVLRAQAGVSLADVMAFAIPRGFMPPVLPGTKHITLGGAFACNVHGKNHFRRGDFAEHVLSIRLLLADGRSLECSPQEHAELFWATAGGMGMTGIIEDITLKLLPIASASLKALRYRVDTVHDMVAAFEAYRESHEYLIGWVDHMARGEALGRGVFEAASHAPAGDGALPFSRYTPPPTRVRVPFFLPAFVLNRYSMALYNRWRFGRVGSERATRLCSMDEFFHPLDGMGEWYRLYGRRGFFQYQCLIPDTQNVAENLRRLLSMLQEMKLFSYLAVIKYHRDGKGMLTFPLRGYSLAFDLPNTKRVRALLPQVSRWVAERGGRVYLAKDALLTPQQFNHMYSTHAGQWRDILQEVDPHARFLSRMAERLEWKPWQPPAS
jgi:decaprenylphospho-beta-D-ribofuranose 2-oxidase